MEVEAKEAAQRTAPGNSLQEESEASDAHEEGEDQGEAVLAMMGALQVHLPTLIIFITPRTNCKQAREVEKQATNTLLVQRLVIDEFG